jgi:hypothetical protein
MAAGDLKGVLRANRVGEKRFDRVASVADRARRTREVEYPVKSDIANDVVKWLNDVVLEEGQPWVSPTVLQVDRAAGQIVIDDDDFIATVQQPIDDMAADEP